MDLNDIVFAGFANTVLYEQMYAAYRTNPEHVNASWREFFASLESETQPRASSQNENITSPRLLKSSIRQAKTFLAQEQKDLRLSNLIQAYRNYGHLLAHTNPISAQSPDEPNQLKLKSLGFSHEDLDKQFPTLGLMTKETSTLKEIIEHLRSIYCYRIGFEYCGFVPKEVELWLQEQIETGSFRKHLTIEQKQMILQQLNKSELFESFLHTKYVGQKRFSLEGSETLIPMMASIVEEGADLGIDEFVIGMAHRGRLNVLCNIMDKSYSEVFAEFEESYTPPSFEGSGDVKYHKGFSSEILTSHGRRVQIFMTPNPSHLESVDPVVEGQVRAKQMQRKEGIRENQVAAILIHGDAALSGQGVVYETLQLSQLQGYSTGGTLHLVINNQIGFTTIPTDARSTFYCTDIARTFGAPVFHVNAEDPEGCVYATNLALAIRQKFHIDVFVDLNCYRKYGHNEGDEPAFTQPLEYQLIKQKMPIRELYRDQLIRDGLMEKFLAEELETEFKKALNQALKGSKLAVEANNDKANTKLAPAKEEHIFQAVETGISFRNLQMLTEKFCTIPRDFHAHPKLSHLIHERLTMVQAMGPAAKPLDWGMAETLAYASLLWEGFPIRLSGQDTCRGTFSHRHAMWIDQKVAKRYFSLAHLKNDQGRFEVYNSPLSEFAALGFEFGYSLSSPHSLVIWEAQFGDFSNSAQVIIDQYLAPSQQKWGKTVNLVLLLPHGYEGQGPEHSSGRIERFLTLAGNNNMVITNPTKPAQFFHLLRRQMLKPMFKPLIVFTPKGLLRHPECVNPIQDFIQGSFREILDDPRPPSSIKRLVFCSGRIFYDAAIERSKIKNPDLVLIRIEQLYPLHEERLKEIILKYQGAEEYIWLQEEPRNMGAWNFIREPLEALIPNGKPLRYIGRERSASPAVGAHFLHKKEQMAMMTALFPSKQEPYLDVGILHRV